MNKILNIINYKSIQKKYLLNKEWIVEQIIENPTYYYIRLNNNHHPYLHMAPIVIEIQRELNPYTMTTDIEVVYMGLIKDVKRKYEVKKDTIKYKELFIEELIKEIIELFIEELIKEIIREVLS